MMASVEDSDCGSMLQRMVPGRINVSWGMAMSFERMASLDKVVRLRPSMWMDPEVVSSRRYSVRMRELLPLFYDYMMLACWEVLFISCFKLLFFALKRKVNVDRRKTNLPDLPQMPIFCPPFSSMLIS